ncbi:MAG: methyltransferase domain-containing protein [Planctomycetes bacterium]|nr:methyltransferase domain-containing protein [Planctomycetota bacterium]
MTDLVPALKELMATYRRARGGRHISDTIEAVTVLSDMFLGRRPTQPGYLSKQHLRRAYVEYYLPLNACKVARILDEMARYAGPFLRGTLRVLDYGCGPGTAALAFRLWGGRASRLVLADVVEEALDEAEALLGPTFERAAEAPPGPFDVIFASNVLVELGDAGRFEPLLERLDPRGYAVVVEPPTAECARRLMEWRDRLVERGWRVAAPCLGIARCPMRAMPDLWCHQDAGWSPPGWVNEIDDRIGRVHETLKYSYLVLTREGATLAEGADWRLVSNLHRSKGRAWAHLCGHEGDLWKAQALTRDREELRDFFRCDRGDLLRVQGPAGGRLGPDHRIRRE